MISSMCQQGEWLYSLSSNTLSAYQLGEFLGECQCQLPKIQSPLGISLRQATTKITIKQLSPSSECRFVNMQQGKQLLFEDDKLLLIYDKKTIVGVNAKGIVNGIKNKKSLVENGGDKGNSKQVGGIDWKYEVQAGEEIASALGFYDQEGKKRVIINTTSGRILLINNLQLSEQPHLHPLSISLQALRSTTTTQIHNQNTTTNYLSIIHQTNQSTNQHKQYITAVNINKNILYCATTQSKLIAVDQKMRLVGEVDLRKEVSEIVGNGQDKVLEDQCLRPRKVILVRNSLIVLYCQCLIQFNTHTCTVTNSLSLPFNTLDLTVQHHPKTQSTTLIMVGQCNTFYSIPYPWNQSKQKTTPLFKKVTISSKLGKSILQTNNNYLFVGGCDGTIDVYKNASMHMMVLLQM